MIPNIYRRKMGGRRLRVKTLIPLAGFILACGGEIEGQLSTVEVSVSLNQSSIEADTAFWVDTNNDNVCDTYYIYPTNVNLQINVKRRFGLPQEVSPSDVEVVGVEIVYSKANTESPPLSTEYRPGGPIISPDSSAVIGTEILSRLQKKYLIDTFFVIRDNPARPIYSYYVTLRIRVREVSSGDEDTIERTLYMQVADFLSEGECG